MGCNSNIASKANSDFDKRTEEFSEEYRQSNSFIFVTPHRWYKKDEWLENKRALESWKSINVIDADDMETWFENAPAVALEFGEKIGISGTGVESVNRYWQNWSEQSSPSISVNAIQKSREQARNTLIELIEKKPALITVEADSREEAAAFCASIILNHPLNRQTACITSKDGWMFVESNPELQLIILTSFGIASNRSPREGITIIQPICHGDDVHNSENENKVSIPRSTPDTFKDVLIELGEEETDARRLTSSSGRSWSVYRRLRAVNPIIRQPTWLEGVDHDNLVVLLLVGAWDSSSAGDIALIEALTNKPYEDIEECLCDVAMSDDSPVINIRNIWKAKSPIELLYLVAPKLSKPKLKRFLNLTKAILNKPDPKLELPEDERWMANIYGKVRDESGVVIKSLLNSLIKLKVFAETTKSNISYEINLGIDNLLRDLLFDVDENTWMSLANYLPSLAEASPDIFLACLENSLSKAEQPVAALIKNTTGTAFGNQCWYSGLLWALETIAWNPSKLPRVTNILIELDKTPNESNWGNSPLSSLESFYRPHFSQTLATPEQKIEILKSVISRHESFAWHFILSLIPSFGSLSLNNSRPRWRDDDAGNESEKGVYYPHYLSWIGETVLALAQGKPERIAKLIEKYSLFEGSFKQQLITMVENINDYDDIGKEIILNQLRDHLSYYLADDIDAHDKDLGRLKNAYYGNQPTNLTIRYKWLFQNRWCDLPEGERRDYKKTEELRHTYRANAIKHIWDESGAEGIEQLKTHSEDVSLIGHYVAKYLQEIDLEELISFAFKVFIDSNYQYQEPFLNGVISHISITNLPKLIKLLSKNFSEYNLNAAQQVAALACLPPNKEVFSFVDKLDKEISNIYWNKVNFFYQIDKELFDFILQKFISLNRYYSAFKFIEHVHKTIQPELVFNILNKLLKVKEEGINFPDGYGIKRAIEYISESGVISQRDLATIEFAYLPTFHDPRYIPPNLLKELLSTPKTFVELVCFVFKPEGKYPLTDDFESSENMTKIAWRVLNNGRGIPGIQKDESIDITTFNQWVNEVRKIGRQFDRETMTDQSIGQWFSKCPEQEEGIWPCYPVCELLEQSNAAEIRKGFWTGVKNNRGIVSKAYGEGGIQEHKLADKYRNYANKIQNLYPQTAALLNDIAQSYKYEANIEDDEAKLEDELD